MSDEHRLLRAFLEETEELLEKLNRSLLELEKDSANLELVHEIFRLTHSLKSESALIGFANLSELAHRLEDVFERLRSGGLILNRELLDTVLEASDLIQEMVTRIARGEGDAGVEIGALEDELARLAGRQPALAAIPAASPPAAARRLPPVSGAAAERLSAAAALRAREALERGELLYCLRFRTVGEPAMRYPRAYLVYSNLERVANVLGSTPQLDVREEEGEDGYAEVSILFSSDLPEAELAKAYRVQDIELIELVQLEGVPAWGSREGEPRAAVPTSLSGGAVKPGGAGAAPEGAPALALARGTPGLGSPGSADARGGRSSVRVDTSKLDDLWQLVGELVTCKARFSRLTAELAGVKEDRAAGSGPAELLQDVEKIADSLERVAGRMQQAVMETRMVPIAVLFNKFPRLVRDLSRKLGKEVELAMSGGQTEIDRSLVEALSDPLTHLIRNCLDHGIETVESRLAGGKPASGRVSISAQQRGGKIVIEVADDGRGLDLDRIRQVAQAAPETTDEELMNFIFQPGFSTRQSVSELSGRGVGLDVVATRVKENLRGEVQVSNLPGRGLTVTILLPLTLTILHSLLVSSAGQFYAVPIRDIDETVQVEPTALRPTRAGEQVALGEEEIPAIRLGALLAASPEAGGQFAAQGAAARGPAEPGFTPAPAQSPQGGVEPAPSFALQGVVARSKGQRYCLLVDELVEELDLVIKPLSEVLNRKRLFSGVSVLGDGRIVFILDTSRIAALPG
jgi:two-component system chemotaxis sensor kinase CheA